MGKRNYAMTLLASRLGLRASDIANLRFSQIDWDNNLITLTMQKTHKIIQLPLLAEVGNALIDYLRSGRPGTGLWFARVLAIRHTGDVLMGGASGAGSLLLNTKASQEAACSRAPAVIVPVRSRKWLTPGSGGSRRRPCRAGGRSR